MLETNAKTLYELNPGEPCDGSLVSIPLPGERGYYAYENT